MRILINEKLSEHKMKTPEGYLICTDAILARTGKQDYMKKEVFDGCDDEDMISINRKEDDVFKDETIASFENKPITWDHPNENVTPENYRQLSVGYVRNVRKGTFEGQPVMMADLVITDADAIKQILDGEHTELSCGYDCDIVQDGDDYKQSNIRGNHIALCEQGRAGIARIVDSVEDALDVQTNDANIHEQTLMTFAKTLYTKYHGQGEIVSLGHSIDRVNRRVPTGKQIENYRVMFKIDKRFYNYKVGEALEKESTSKFDVSVGAPTVYIDYEVTVPRTSHDALDAQTSHMFKLSKTKNEYDEYVVKEYVDGKYREDGSYYTDDWDDAVATMKDIARRAGLTVKQQGSRYIADSINDKLVDEPKAWEELKKVLISKGYKLDKEGKTFTDRHHLEFVGKYAIDEKNFKEEAELIINEIEKIENKYKTPSTYNIGRQSNDIIRAVVDIDKKFVKDSIKDAQKVYTLLKGLASNHFRQYLRDRGIYFETSGDDKVAHFVVSNPDADVDKEYEATKRHEHDSIIEDEFACSEVIYDSTNDAPAKTEEVDTTNYVVGNNGVWFARAKGEKSLLTKAYCSNDKGKTWHTCNLEVKTENKAHPGQTQAGKYFFRTASSFDGPRTAIGRNVLTWYAAHGEHNYKEGYQIDHIDNNYRNDELSNLQRITREENLRKMNEYQKSKHHDSTMNDDKLSVIAKAIDRLADLDYLAYDIYKAIRKNYSDLTASEMKEALHRSKYASLRGAHLAWLKELGFKDADNHISDALDATKATKLVKIVKIASQIKK